MKRTAASPLPASQEGRSSLALCSNLSSSQCRTTHCCTVVFSLTRRGSGYDTPHFPAENCSTLGKKLFFNACPNYLLLCYTISNISLSHIILSISNLRQLVPKPICLMQRETKNFLLKWSGLESAFSHITYTPSLLPDCSGLARL